MVLKVVSVPDAAVTGSATERAGVAVAGSATERTGAAVAGSATERAGAAVAGSATERASAALGSASCSGRAEIFFLFTYYFTYLHTK